jgi:hypothetical protein
MRVAPQPQGVAVMTYNGWSNYDTWNVMLWLNNDYGLYTRKEEFLAKCITAPTYRELIRHIGIGSQKTGDGILFDSPSLDLQELDDHLSAEWHELKAYRKETNHAG